MGALAKLIVRCTKRQFAMAKTTQEVSEILDRTIQFAEGDHPYLTEEDVADIASTIPVPDPVTEVEYESSQTDESTDIQ